MKRRELKSLLSLFMRLIKKNLTGFIFFLFLWFVLSLIFPPSTIPAPQKVIPQNFSQIDYEFSAHLQITLLRLLIGFSLAFAFATSVGIVSYELKIMEYTENILSLFQVIPGAILAIIFLIIFGMGNLVPIALIIAVTIPIMAINTSTALRQILTEQKEVVYVFGGSKLQVIRYVYLPALIPVFRSNLLLGSGLALKVIILGEFIGCENGLGFLLNNASTVFNMEDVLFYLFIIILIALVLHMIINLFFIEFLRKYLP